MMMYMFLLVCALASALHLPDNTVSDPEELLGRKFGSKSIYVQERHLNRLRRQANRITNVKLNKQYQPCIAFGNTPGYCRHLRYCPLEWNILGNPKILDSLCVIDNSAVGICCPEDLKISPASAGSNILMNLPTDGQESAREDSEKRNTTTVRRDCGTQHYSRNQQSLVKDWPWMAALLNNENKLFCGGSLITDQHVLTAAHCTDGRRSEDMKVRLGEYDFFQSKETRTINFLVVQINQHIDFDATTYDNDISLLRLNRRTTFNSYIWPICLPPVGLNYTNLIVTVTGWGRQSFGSHNTSNILMEVSMPVWEHEKCAKSFTQTITNNVICAAGFEGGKDACQGDSGGPLQYQLENGRWVVIGVVSWGIGCGDVGRPGIYTRVDNYQNWIISNIFS